MSEKKEAHMSERGRRKSGKKTVRMVLTIHRVLHNVQHSKEEPSVRRHREVKPQLRAARFLTLFCRWFGTTRRLSVYDSNPLVTWIDKKSAIDLGRRCISTVPFLPVFIYRVDFF